MKIRAPEPFDGYWDTQIRRVRGVEYIDSTDSVYGVESDIADAPKPWKTDTVNDPNGAYPMEGEKKAAIGELWAEHFLDTQGGNQTNIDAFQLAIWEIIFEEYDPSNWNVTSTTVGDFWLVEGPSGVAAKAQGYLDDVKDASGPSSSPTLWAWVSPIIATDCYGYQDQLVQFKTYPAPPAVPEPAVVVQLAGLGLMFGLGGLRRNRRRRQK